jgi:exosortase
MEIGVQNRFSDVFRENRAKLLLLGILFAGLYYRVFPPMVMQWYGDENYSHGFIVPVIAGYFLYLNLGKLKESRVLPSNFGIVVIIFALIQLTIGYVGTEFFSMRLSIVVLLSGIVLYLFGKDVLKVMSLPIGYLFFMVPLPYIVYDSIAFPLKLFVAKYSVIFLKLIGISVWRDGNIIMLSNTVLEVADACSGIRSLMSLLALSVAFAYLSQDSFVKRIIVILSAIPIAIFANGVRVIVTGILAQHWGAKAAEGFFHEFAGLAVFGVAVVMLLLTGALLRRKKG